MKKPIEPPDGIIITVSQSMIGPNGYRHWLRNFLEAMADTEDDRFYWFRQGNRPKDDRSLRFVYLCIGGKIRYRVFYAGSEGERTMKFDNREDELHGKAWILTAGPVVRAPRVIKRQGFQGFRYTQEIF
jgi:hypothetical protein